MIKKIGFVVAFILLATISTLAQGFPFPGPGTRGNHSSGGGVTGAWTWLQGASGSVTASSGLFGVQNACGASPTATCTIQTAPTTAGSVRVIGLVTDTSNNLTISSAYDCTTPAGCNSGNAGDTASLCGSSACHIHTSNDNVDAVYIAGGAAGQTSVTFNISGIPSSNYYFLEYQEILPPSCSGSPCAVSFDANVAWGNNTGACSTSCGSAMSLAATDGILSIIDTSTVVNMALPYLGDFIGNPFALDATTAPANKFSTTGWITLSELAFKTSGGAYTPATAPFSLANLSAPTHIFITNVNCSPTCSITLPQTTGTAFLLFLQVGPYNANTQAISSVTGGGTWVVPTGANTCANSSGPQVLSCAYVLSSTSGTTSLSVTLAANCTSCSFAFYEVGRTTGSFALDTQNSSVNSTPGSTISGQSLTLNGSTPDVCFQEVAWAGNSALNNITTIYPLPQGENFFANGSGSESTMMLLNTMNGTAPSVILSASTASSSAAGICFK